MGPEIRCCQTKFKNCYSNRRRQETRRGVNSTEQDSASVQAEFSLKGDLRREFARRISQEKEDTETEEEEEEEEEENTYGAFLPKTRS